MDRSSRREKVDHYVDSDRLSDLPLGIIHMILARIPIRNAVRTSLLSTQWRYTWTTLPQLVFDDEFALDEGESVSSIEFITRFLFRHKGPIHMFRMLFSGHFPNLDEWIFCLSRNGIQELNLELDPDNFGFLKMGSSLYSCKTLRDLSLYGCELDPPPLTCKGFLFLRRLSLHTVRGMSPDAIYRLVAICPNLEIFELRDIEGLELKISAPNLKYMNLHVDLAKLCIDAPLMTEISISLELSLNDVEGPDEACDYAKCFGGFSNLQKLFGSVDFIKYLSLRIEVCHHSLVFHHLKVIHLEYVNSKDAKQMMVVAHLLIGAPNLQEFKIKFYYHHDIDDESDSEAPHMSFKDLGCASNYKLERLSVVSLYIANGLAMEVDFLKFLLESSPALETMGVGLRKGTEEKWNNMRAKLEGCNWASPTVKICPRVWYYTNLEPFPLPEISR